MNCGRPLPPGFPGANVFCACGFMTPIPATSASRGEAAPKSQGPYRSSSPVVQDERATPCPYCGNACPPLVRICPHCDVRLENVRCTTCYSLHVPGSFACARCGHPLELEPLFDAIDAPCPRCATPLESAQGGDDGRLHECPRCGGIFVPRDALVDLLCRAEIAGPFLGGQAKPGLDPVTYVPCPLCHATMNRVNFGKVSGVIVDVCRTHGTWFDAGELTRVVAFASSGGLDKTRFRQQQEKAEIQAQARAVHMDLIEFERREDRRTRGARWKTFLDTWLWR